MMASPPGVPCGPGSSYYVGSGALAQGSTHKSEFLANRKDQNVFCHQKLFGGPQMSLREAWYQFETHLSALSTILPESDHFFHKPVRKWIFGDVEVNW